VPLRRLTAREYSVNLVMTVACWPVYSRREWADRERLDAFALQRTRDMAVHAARNVPVYRDRYRAAGVDPGAIRTWTDVLRLPLMDKATIVDGYPDRSTARGTDLAACLLSTSSGSSGQMMTVPHRADRFWPYLLSGQRMLRWAAGGRYPFWWRHAYVYTSEYPLMEVPGLYPMRFIPTAGRPESILDELEALRPQVLHTYPSVLRDLISLDQRRMHQLGLKGTSVGSELSTQDERDAWEAVLGCRVRDEYSSEELGRIASQCPDGRYHVHEDVVYLETLDPDGRPTDGIGEIVGTEFHNRTMPFVRYRQGDQARLSDEICSCGRKTRLLVDLKGRENDGFVLEDGRRLAPGFLLDICYRALIAAGEGAAMAYRFIQIDRAHADLEFVPGAGFQPATTETMAGSLRGELSGTGLTIRVLPVESIPRPEGGKRATVFRQFP
jgi:phenylacetate-CoA ligase